MQTGSSSVQEALRDTEYPAEKRDLVEHARQQGAGKDVLDDIKIFLTKYTQALLMSTRNLKTNKKNMGEIYENKYG